MYAERHVLTLVTAANGSVTGYSPVVTGRISAIHYVKAGAGSYADTVDFAITAEATGEGLWTEANVTASKVCAPRQAVHTIAGVAAVLASGGEAVRDKIALAQDRVKVAITNGGDTKTGTFHIVME